MVFPRVSYSLTGSNSVSGITLQGSSNPKMPLSDNVKFASCSTGTAGQKNLISISIVELSKLYRLVPGD